MGFGGRARTSLCSGSGAPRVRPAPRHVPSSEGTHVPSRRLHNVPHEPGCASPVARGGRLRASYRLAVCLVLTPIYALRPLATAVLTGGNRAAVARSGARTFSALCRVLGPVLGVRVEVEGDAPPPGPCVLCPNHVSYLDVLVLASVADAVFVSRGDVAGWPGIGPLARLGGTVFIDRARKRDAARAADEVGVALDRRLRAVMFLEGRATVGDAVLAFRSSLLEPACARPGVPCVAATLRYDLPDDPGSTVAGTVAWADETPFAKHVMRVLRLRTIAVRVTFHAPRTGTDRKALAAALEADCRRGLSATGRSPAS